MGWNRAILAAIDACIAATGATPGALVSENWNQSVLTKLAELATSISALSATAAANAAILAKRTNTNVLAVNSSDDTNGTTFCSLSLVAGRKYRIFGSVGCTTALASTALNTQALASGGLVAANAAFSWLVSQTTTQIGGATPIDTWTTSVSGLGTAARMMVINGHIEPSVSGTLLLQVRSEVSGSRVDILYGNIMLEDVT